MDAIETALHDACDDQRDALRKFHETGSEADAARVHFESCLSCMRALDALAALRGGAPALPPPIQGNRPRVLAFFALTCALTLALIGFVGYLVVSTIFDTVDASELDAAERRVRYVRMPGRPGVCVAEYPGHGGFGPMYLGAARCGEVSDRVVSGEGASDGLREHVIVRIRGTDMCLAHAPKYDNDFTFPCGD